MLNQDALSQLSKLKDDIQASKDYGQGTVAGSSGRFGFVRLEDGRDAFLSPDKMARLIPGDIVKVSVTKNDKDQLEAHLEELVESPLIRFVGQYRVKGAGHFVVPVGAQAAKWIFIPPKMRKGCKEGDFVYAMLTQHPYKDGKAQAKVLERIGQETDPYIERKYVAAMHDLGYRPHPKDGDEVKKIVNAVESDKAKSFPDRENLCHMPFVTIDAETTRDMDDALFVEAQEIDGKPGFRLYVAIADPGSFITPGSPMAKRAQICVNSVYLLGGAIPMLPEELSNQCFSLLEGEQKPALVCTIDLAEDGSVVNAQFMKAVIQSKHKLSYNQVADILDSGASTELSDEIVSMLQQLHTVAQARTQLRKEKAWVGDDQLDYDYTVDAKGKISQITPRPRTSAHQIVEESMLLTNMCAGEFLQQKGLGLATAHDGFRTERLGEVKALLKEEDISQEEDINELQGHLKLLKTIENTPEKSHLLAPLKRLMQASVLTHNHAPHMGMGFEAYATVTSPIRRYADMYNHWAISQALGGKKVNRIPDGIVERINERVQEGRQADRELTQWLLCQYAESLIGEEHQGKIRIVTQQGFGVRLDETGLDGFVLFPKKLDKTYDAKRMTLQIGDVVYSLDQPVTIKVTSVDHDKRRIAFEIIDPKAEITESE
ncbi:VacB/RNase II family 3'-5' exoribonuclease [Teredinibacter sp. KSP-S5-2]|uniref:VacB/RNase II family 3'-5' exoribonuclease n=1 Tax=Teredinibacter sp. KSP-S5-2 TaxID=3034506 RepID=UPI0029352B38|nr:VacB/RNase II family 3'-5' exoribonuclease [Teredinibacter sp. KSP-S5-2]WNO09894.1 VacB/RNase II family 3'-5' exoribonuclease [Teredinibacter sp. KSP-S5-2]